MEAAAISAHRRVAGSAAVTGPGAEQPDGGGGGGQPVDGGHVGGWQGFEAGRRRGIDAGAWGGVRCGGAEQAQDGIADGQEAGYQRLVHLERDCEAALFAVQPGAQVGGRADQLAVAPAAAADGVGRVDGERVAEPAPPDDCHTVEHKLTVY